MYIDFFSAEQQRRRFYLQVASLFRRSTSRISSPNMFRSSLDEGSYCGLDEPNNYCENVRCKLIFCRFLLRPESTASTKYIFYIAMLMKFKIFDPYSTIPKHFECLF